MIQVSSLASSSSLVSFTNSMMGSASPGKAGSAGSAGSADADADAKGFKGLLSWSSRGMINMWGPRLEAQTMYIDI